MINVKLTQVAIDIVLCSFLATTALFEKLSITCQTDTIGFAF